MNKIINGYEIKPKANLRYADLRGAIISTGWKITIKLDKLKSPAIL
jgi:hypothetical protein